MCVGEFGQLHQCQHLRAACPATRLVPALQLERQLDVAFDRAPLEQPALLKRHAIVLIESGLMRRLAVDDQVSRSGLDEIGDQAQQRRLAAARRTDQ